MSSQYERLPTSDSPPYSPYKPAFTDLDVNDDVELNGSSSPLFDAQGNPLTFPHTNHYPHNTTSLTGNARTRDTREAIRAFHADPRFHQPQPTVYARAGLLIFMFSMFWLAYGLRKAIWFDFGMGGDEGVVVEEPNLGY